VLAFAVFNNETFAVHMADTRNEQAYKDFLDIKLFANVYRSISIGGWSFSYEPTRARPIRRGLTWLALRTNAGS
jgi:hypothetical protein